MSKQAARAVKSGKGQQTVENINAAAQKVVITRDQPLGVWVDR